MSSTAPSPSTAAGPVFTPEQAAAAPDPYMPGHGTNAYRVSRYELDLDYKLSTNRLSGRAVLHAVTQYPTAALVLDLAGLRATKIQLGGRRVRKFSQRAEQLVIVPDAALPAGEHFTLDIRYEGSPAPRRGLWGEVGWEELTDGVLVAGQPNGAASWFPCNDHPRDKASYRISVTTDANYRAVCNGELISHTSRASRETWVYEQAEPMATYLATAQIGRYEFLTLAGPSLDGHVPQFVAVPAMLADSARQGLARQREMMLTFTNCFGPYPFPEYTVVVTEDELEIPLEAQTLSIFGRNHLEQDWESQRLIAHELAHQWFGNSLTAASWADIWLHEGFACYAEWIWSEEAGVLPVAQRAAAAWRKLAAGRQDITVGDPGPELMFDDRVYKRGALALHALRLRCGDLAFFALLQDWTGANRHGSVSTAGFILAADRTTGLDSEALLHPWLHETALPPLPVSPQ
ncbi:M1 family metallopeptidase [Arthrobacter sp. HMWF013]|uniref:M1 family metallopeptidase n=1 Tax=Arthrobacter sp. HMWF013 TaxID=2056849 RepID=UPI000D3D8B1D|nr:M1 family metallopeptidase [Arthrobacter sp. HMWF013]PTT63187.1 peptidase M1 [Arthrobacter sp. HMWF013]